MRLGFCETDITPRKPAALVGFYRPDNLSKGIAQPLTAQTAVWEDGERMCLVTIDSIGFRKELADSLRERIGRRLAIPVQRVMLCFSHTHSAPNADLERAYYEETCAAIEEAAAFAAEHTAPVSVGWANACADIGVNRRPISDVVDDRVGILKVCDADTGAMKLVILRVTAHGNVLKRDNYMVSPDYFGAVREVIGAKYGCPVMMIQGSAGNTAPKYFNSAETPVDARSPLCVRSETALYDMAHAIEESIRPVMGKIKLVSDCRLSMYSRFIELTSRVPSREEALKVAEDAEKLCGIRDSGWLAKVAGLTEAGVTQQTESVELQYFSIGSWCLCGGPYEFMVGFALDTQRLLNDEFFYMNGYTNAVLLYFPTDDEFDCGGYEVFWSMLIYYVYIDRVYPFDRGSADRLIRFAVDNRE